MLTNFVSGEIQKLHLFQRLLTVLPKKLESCGENFKVNIHLKSTGEVAAVATEYCRVW